MDNYAPIVAAVVSAFLSGGVALICWGVKNEVKLMRTEMALAMTQAENRFYEKINGSYVRTKLYDQVIEEMKKDLERIESRVDGIDG